MPRETAHPPAELSLDPHAAQAVLAAGAPLAQAKGVVLMLHGRGASAADILGLSEHFNFPRAGLFSPPGGRFHLVSKPLFSPVGQQPALAGFGLEEDRQPGQPGRRRGHPHPAHLPAGIFARRLPGAGICRAQRAALGRGLRVERRPDRPTRHAATATRMAAAARRSCWAAATPIRIFRARA